MSLLFPAIMTSLHPGISFSIKAGHFVQPHPTCYLGFDQFKTFSTWIMAESAETDLSKHPALTSFITPPVTKPLLESLDLTNPPLEGEAHLHWLLDINNQFFCWELQQVVSTLFVFNLLLINVILFLQIGFLLFYFLVFTGL